LASAEAIVENRYSGLNVGKEVWYASTTLPVFDKGGSAGDVGNVENVGSEEEQIFY
jgi:hypothetical protein